MHRISKYILLLIIITTMQIIPYILMKGLYAMAQNKYGKNNSFCYMELR